MVQTHERSKETETAIIRALMKLSLVRDVREITVREICAEAGVSVGAFYHHFPSRQAMFLRAYENVDRELCSWLETRKESRSTIQKLIDLLLFQVTFVSQEAGGILSQYYVSLLSEPDLANVSPDRLYYRSVYQCVHQLAKDGMLLPDRQPDKIAAQCICFVRGYLFDWCLHSQSYDVVAAVREALPTLLQGFFRDQ